MGADLMSRALDLISSGEAVFTKQDDSLSTYAGMISKQDGKIDFSDTACAIDRKVRAFDPWPGAFCDFDGKTMKVWKAEPVENRSDAEPGTVIEADREGILVSCGEGEILITEIQMPGKKRTSVRDFLLGHTIEKGTKLS